MRLKANSYIITKNVNYYNRFLDNFFHTEAKRTSSILSSNLCVMSLIRIHIQNIHSSIVLWYPPIRNNQMLGQRNK